MKLFIKALIIVFALATEMTGQHALSFKGGIAYYDFLDRPLVNLNDGQSLKLTHSSQDFTHIGFLIGITDKIKMNSIFSLKIGAEVADRKRLIHGVPNYVTTLGPIIYTNFQYYAVYLDLPVEFSWHLNSKFSIFTGVAPSRVLKKYFFAGQELVQSTLLQQTKKHVFDFSLLTGIDFDTGPNQTYSLRLFYSLPKSLGIFDTKKYGLGGIQLNYSYSFKKSTL